MGRNELPVGVIGRFRIYFEGLAESELDGYKLASPDTDAVLRPAEVEEGFRGDGPVSVPGSLTVVCHRQVTLLLTRANFANHVLK